MKDTILRRHHTINCKGKLLNLDEPIVMGILNITPDSFYDGGKNDSAEAAIKQTEKHLNEGATIIDIGGYSSRPGAKDVTAEAEVNRIIPVIDEIINRFPETIISVDTFRAEVAKKAVESGAAIVNDISGGNLDDKMFNTIAELNVPYIMMHMQNSPQNMQHKPTYDNVVMEVAKFFSKQLNTLKIIGVSDVILDPGFGFGKTIEHNYKLLNELSHFEMFELPILAGISRKSMLYKPLGINPEEALNSTTAANMIALERGAKILRVHDCKEAMECIRIHNLTHQK